MADVTALSARSRGVPASPSPAIVAVVATASGAVFCQVALPAPSVVSTCPVVPSVAVIVLAPTVAVPVVEIVPVTVAFPEASVPVVITF